jgi:membrane protease YdiL (CAAX protease family)
MPKGENLRDPEQFAAMMQTLTPPAALAGFFAGGVAFIVLSRYLVGEKLKETSPTSAAWVMGSWKSIGKGVAVGALLAATYILLVMVTGQQPTSFGPVAKMSAAAGLSRSVWITLALVAPFIEEPLFRGVLFAGYSKWIGPIWAAILTTLIFVLLHITETIGFWPAMIAMAVFALAALWLRLRSAAIGPAVGAHFGFNGFLVMLSLLS